MESTLKILILLGIIQFCLSSLNIFAVEKELEKSTRTFAEKETIISQMVSHCDLYLKYSSSNLKASNIANNLTTILDSGRNLTSVLKSLKNHDSFESFADFTTCDYIKSRQSTIEMDLNRYDLISSDAVANVTKFFQLRKEISESFASNFKILLYYKSKALTLVYTIREFGKTSIEFFNYLQSLAFGNEYLENLKIYLDETAKSLNCSTTSSNFQENGKKIDFKLEFFEDGLKGAHAIALAKIQNALKSVTATTTNQSSTKLNMEALLSTLSETKTVENYPVLKWPNLPDNPGHGMKLKLRTTVEKKQEYMDIKEDSARNQSRIELKRKAINAQTVNSAANKKVQATSSVIDDVITATINVEKLYDAYRILLDESIAEVDQIYKELVEKGTTAFVITTQSSIQSSISSGTSSTVPLISTPSTLTTKPSVTTTLSTTSVVLTTQTTSISSSTSLPVTTTMNPIATSPIPLTSTTSTVPSTTTAFTTIAPPKVCIRTTSLVSSKGAFLKSTCMLGSSINYYNSTMNCINNGMQLIVLRNLDEIIALYNWMTLVSSAGRAYWINGYYADGAWFVTNPTQAPLFTGAVPQNGSGNCLEFSNIFGNFTTNKALCTKNIYQICELNVTPLI